MENCQKSLILIDGHALAYRMYFALEHTNMRTKDNQPTWAVYGFLNALFEVIKNYKPDAMAISFDISKKTFRHEIYEEYKATRLTMPDPLINQMQAIQDGVKYLSIPVYALEGYEADDVIGSISVLAPQKDYKTYILTGDQDAFQLINDHVRCLIPTFGELVEYNADKVVEKLGIRPDQVIDYKALRGDTSDNIPGVKGIGEKTAVKLLSEYGDLDTILAHVPHMKSKHVRELLEKGQEEALTSRVLATIKKDLDCQFQVEDCSLKLNQVDPLIDYLKKFEFRKFLKDISTILSHFNYDLPQNEAGFIENFSAEEVKKISDQDSQLTLDVYTDHKPEMTYEIVRNYHTLEKIVQDIQKKRLFSLDLETTSLNIFEAQIVGIALSTSDSLGREYSDSNGYEKLVKQNDAPIDSFYIPVGHKVGEQLDRGKVLSILQPVLEDKTIAKILQNAKYDISILQHQGIKTENILFDTMIASYILNPSNKHGLKEQGFRFFGYTMTEYQDVTGMGKSKKTICFDEVPIEDAAAYAASDAFVTYKLARLYSEKFLQDEEKLFYQIEMPLVKVLIDIELEGVSIDVLYLKQLSNQLNVSIHELSTKIYELAGCEFKINSPKQVGEILFEQLDLGGLKKPRTKTGYSTESKVLEGLVHEHEIAQYILDYRQLSKLASTYVDALPQLINAKTGRIHTSYNQTVVVTGRLSSSNPNLQNIPIKSDIGNSIRKAFVPYHQDKGLLLSADYSQIELRLLAHYSEDPVLVHAFTHNIDVHTLTASKVFGVKVENVTKEMRRIAKAVNFGIIYGQGPYGLSTVINVSPNEAKTFIDKYFAEYKSVKGYMEEMKEFAHAHGYVSTWYGRKRFLENDLQSRNKSIKEFAERAAMNTPLQGTAADIIKIAMIDLHHKLQEAQLKSKIIMQVHDELVLETSLDEVETLIPVVRHSMEIGQPFKVPLVIDINYGKNWFEA